MTAPLATLVFVTFALLAVVVLLSRFSRPSAAVGDPVPDAPIPFGHETGWLAIKTENTVSVVETLGLVEPKLANWESGLAAVEDQATAQTAIFISPPVEGWTFVVGLALPLPMGRSFVDKVGPLLVKLGRRYPDVQYFLNLANFDYFSWQRFRDGRFVRVFAANDEGVVANKGRPTDEERALGFKLFELRGVRDRQGDAGGELLLHPTERHVLVLAGAWSLDPTRIAPVDDQGQLGYVGRAPRAWAARRSAGQGAPRAA